MIEVGVVQSSRVQCALFSAIDGFPKTLHTSHLMNHMQGGPVSPEQQWFISRVEDVEV
jgi:hypothetical protein